MDGVGAARRALSPQDNLETSSSVAEAGVSLRARARASPPLVLRLARGRVRQPGAAGMARRSVRPDQAMPGSRLAAPHQEASEYGAIPAAGLGRRIPERVARGHDGKPGLLRPALAYPRQDPGDRALRLV